ncbi:MAG: hypothetical protein ACFFCS_24060 [Candidatus Hodarchaeota archaeon]
MQETQGEPIISERTSCLICHEPLDVRIDKSIACSDNQHQVHLRCLESWVRGAKLLSSEEIYCPICLSGYPSEIVKELFQVKQVFQQEGKEISFELQLHDVPDDKVTTWEKYAKKINLAQEAIEKFNFEIAVLHLFDLLQENPHDAEANFLFGIINFEKANYILAQHFFYKTIWLDRDHYLANMFLGEIMLMDGKKRECIRLFKKARSIMDKKLSPEEKQKSEDWILVNGRLEYLTKVNYL